MAVVYSQYTSLYVLTNAVSCSSAAELYFLHDENEVFYVNLSGHVFFCSGSSRDELVIVQLLSRVPHGSQAVLPHAGQGGL